MTMTTGANKRLGRGSARRLVELGHAATDFNGRTGPHTISERTDVIVGLATVGSGVETGRFVDRIGEITW